MYLAVGLVQTAQKTSKPQTIPDHPVWQFFKPEWTARPFKPQKMVQFDLVRPV